MSKKKVVVIGGGNGSATTINALKQYVDEIELSAVITMSDSGGSSGRLKKEFNTLPTGDILRAVLAMSRHDYQTLRPIFNKNRFSDLGNIDGHNLGNLFLVLLEKHVGSFSEALKALHQAVDAVGTVHPVTLEQSDLCVELTDGEIIIGEHEIDRPEKQSDARIERAWLQPTPMIGDGAREALEAADVIIFGPGSLYCSIIASLVVEGMKKGALRNSKAKFMYVVGNAYEQHGEAGPTTLSGFVQTIETYLPRSIDTIVYNNHKLTEQQQQYYDSKQWVVIKPDEKNLEGRHIVGGDFERDGGGLSWAALGKLIIDHIRS